ncbi:MAG: c-type cytochrome biogenesis protein CcmI [Caulobacteraceae bacterium]
MWIFWIVAGALAAAAAALVIARAAAVGRAAASEAEDPALPVYRRQLSDLDGQAERGLMTPQEHQAERAEAARRLLGAATTRRAAEGPGGAKTRLLVMLGAVGAGLTALALYILLGAPGFPDEPYKARVQAWRTGDPARLGPQQMAAVLRSIAQERPHDPQVFDYLGRAELASGDNFAAGRAFEHAAGLSPRDANLRAEQGEALVADGDGKVTPAAVAAFRQALAVDPANAPARYYLGRAQIAGGDLSGGLAGWRSLASAMAPADPRRRALLAEIDQVSRAGRLSAPAQPTDQAPEQAQGDAAPAAPGQMPPGQMAFIRNMVASQAADLAAHPDNPDGWARLVRSYGVLGDPAAQSQALARAEKQFAGRPEVVARIKAEATAAVPTTRPPGV